MPRHLQQKSIDDIEDSDSEGLEHDEGFGDHENVDDQDSEVFENEPSSDVAENSYDLEYVQDSEVTNSSFEKEENIENEELLTCNSCKENRFRYNLVST